MTPEGNPNLAEKIIKMKERRKFERFKTMLDAEYTKVEGYAVINLLEDKVGKDAKDVRLRPLVI